MKEGGRGRGLHAPRSCRAEVPPAAMYHSSAACSAQPSVNSGLARAADRPRKRCYGCQTSNGVTTFRFAAGYAASDSRRKGAEPMRGTCAGCIQGTLMVAQPMSCVPLQGFGEVIKPHTDT